MKRRFVSLVLLFVAAASAVLASPQQKPLTSKGDGPYFIVDYANFRGNENRTYLEFYVQVVQRVAVYQTRIGLSRGISTYI